MMTADSFRRLGARGQILTALGFLGFVGLVVRVMAFTPVELRQGPAQKIMYIHVPAAWWSLTAIFLAGALSAAYLWLKDERIDRAAASLAEVGVAFGVVMLTTGPFWGKPVWGSWWQWDARLTSSLFLILLFAGYLILRDSLVDRSTRARLSAVLGTLGLVLVPFVHLTVYMFRTQHPEPVILKPEGPTMPASMFWTAALGVGVFMVLFLGFVMQRYAVSALEELREDALHHAT